MLTHSQNFKCHCCPQCSEYLSSGNQGTISRRIFVAMGGVLLGGLTLTGLQNSVFASVRGSSNGFSANADETVLMPEPRKQLIAKPIRPQELPLMLKVITDSRYPEKGVTA